MSSKNRIIAIVLLSFLVSAFIVGLVVFFAHAETAQTVGPLYDLDFVTAYSNGDSATVILNLKRLADYGQESPTTLVDVYRIKVHSGGVVIGTEGLAFFSNHNLPMSANGTSMMGIVIGIPAKSSSMGHGPENVGESASESYSVKLDRSIGDAVGSVTVERLYSLIVDDNSMERFDINEVIAQGSVQKLEDWQITVHVNGAVTPENVSIRRSGDTYTLTADISQPIVVLKNNCVLDGANHTLTGFGELRDSTGVNLTAFNVTVQNMRIKDRHIGILGAWNNNTITNNEISSFEGIAVYGNDYIVRQNNMSNCLTGIVVSGGAVRPQGDNNLIMENEMIQNAMAFRLANSNGTIITRNQVIGDPVSKSLSEIISQGASEVIKPSYNTVLYCNDFINCTQKPSTFSVPQWDNGNLGNYWSDYLTRYPDATEIGNTGIGNVPYVIAEGTEVDRYPLMKPFSESTEASSSLPAASLSTLLPTVMAATVAVSVLAVAVLLIVRRIRRSPNQNLPACPVADIS